MSDQSDEDVLYNNASLNDELMGSSSDGDEVSANEHVVQEQIADYGDLERVLSRQQRRSDMHRQQGPSAARVDIEASQGCRRRSVNGIRLFTTAEAGRRRGVQVRSVGACPGAVPDSMAAIEDITAVESQGAASAFSPVVTTSNHISRPSTELPPCRKRCRNSSNRGTWTDSQLHDALAVVDGGWMRWWRHRHPELSLRVSQALETARARGLCAENIKSFYENLQSLLTLHQYSADRIWNCDESSAQAGRNGGGVVIAQKGARHVHSIVPDQREWLSVLVCINADGVSIPSFYVFRGTRFRQNYIERCEPGATMAMQPRAWMTTYLFSAWLSHFIESVQGMGGISAERRHLLILDGHGSHCTLEVVREARAVGLDILTLPAHTSHALQPLDISVFKSVKQNFRAYRDFWTSRNLSQPATKSTLAHWVHLTLRKALTKENIRSGFQGIGIYPINPAAMNSHLAPSKIFAFPTDIAPDISTHSSHELDIPVCNDHAPVDTDVDKGNMNSEDELPGMRRSQRPAEETIPPSSREREEDLMESTSLADEARSRQMEGEFDEVPDSSALHFFVVPDPSDCVEERGEIAGVDIAEGEPESITRFLTLPTITARASSRCKDPLLDFTKSKILTSDEYAAAVQRLNDAKEFAAREKERMRTEKEALRQRKAAEKEARSIAIAEARARRVEEKEEAARLKALRTTEAAAARAAKASEKARRAFTNVRQTRREGRATETEQGHQITVEGAGSPRVSSEAQEP